MNPKPRYYVAVFGEPGAPGKDPVEGGHYGEFPRWPDGMSEGDIVLLYCAKAYDQYPKEAPGIGVVLRGNPEQREFYYRYMPISPPVSLDHLRASFSPDDKQKLGNIRFNTFWVFEIERQSFSQAVAESRIDWP